MAVQRALLMIADVGGYTRFMAMHRVSLVHAQDIIGRLLEAMIDAAPGLELVKLEGDAAFFYAPVASGQESVAVGEFPNQVVAIHRAFHASKRRVASICPCGGCQQIQNLRVKFVAHVGEVATQRVKHHTELAGIDVIVVHRLLKNAVPVAEYLLLSAAMYDHAAASVRRLGSGLAQEIEELGMVQTYFVDLADLAELPPPPAPAPMPRRLLDTVALLCRSLPTVLGVRKLRGGYRNLESATA